MIRKQTLVGWKAAMKGCRAGKKTFPWAFALVVLASSMALTQFRVPLRAYEEDSPEKAARLFLDIVYFNRDVFRGPQWKSTDKNGVRTIKHYNKYDTSNPDTIYTIDKKNWYLSVETVDMVGDTTEAAMYFKKDNTPVVAVGDTWTDTYSTCGSWIRFYEFKCASKTTDSCALKDVTAEVFPSLEAGLFLSESPSAKKIIAEDGNLPKAIRIMYSVPRIGTTITATPAVTYLALGGHGKCQEMVGILSKYKCFKINWNKQKGLFEIGEKVPGLMTLFEN